ncbi:MAG: hypothetical protein HYW71_03235 [Candidatus Niyogibacteria bacterium]|nr:hypothetical protein [Candidatus Niyogibacteria bacterium]
MEHSEEKFSESEKSFSKEKRRLWQIEIGEKGEISGLPEGVSFEDVIIFLGPDKKWWAENPSPEILKEIRLWRSDWKDL